MPDCPRDYKLQGAFDLDIGFHSTYGPDIEWIGRYFYTDYFNLHRHPAYSLGGQKNEQYGVFDADNNPLLCRLHMACLWVDLLTFLLLITVNFM